MGVMSVEVLTGGVTEMPRRKGVLRIVANVRDVWQCFKPDPLQAKLRLILSLTEHEADFAFVRKFQLHLMA